MEKELFLAAHKFNSANADLMTALSFFGNVIAKEENYLSHTGIDAIHWYLICQHGWLPSVVKSLSIDDLLFLMAERTHGMVLPKELLKVLDQA